MRRRAGLRAAFLGLAVVLLTVAVVRERHEIAAALTQFRPRTVALAGALVLAGLGAQMLSWRALFADPSERVPGVREAAGIYFVGQLGKYLPGGVWAVAAQVELGRDRGIVRARGAVVALAAMTVLVVVGTTTGVVLLAWGSGEALRTYWWALLALPPGVTLLVPAVVNRLMARAVRLAGRGTSAPALSGAGVLRSAAWAAVMWAAFGAHAVVLAGDLGARPGDAATLVGGFVLSWVVGFLVVLAPAGAGAREGALVLLLAPVLDAPAALTLALLSRALMVAGDVLVAALAGRRPGSATMNP